MTLAPFAAQSRVWPWDFEGVPYSDCLLNVERLPSVAADVDDRFIFDTLAAMIDAAEMKRGCAEDEGLAESAPLIVSEHLPKIPKSAPQWRPGSDVENDPDSVDSGAVQVNVVSLGSA